MFINTCFIHLLILNIYLIKWWLNRPCWFHIILSNLKSISNQYHCPLLLSSVHTLYIFPLLLLKCIRDFANREPSEDVSRTVSSSGQQKSWCLECSGRNFSHLHRTSNRDRVGSRASLRSSGPTSRASIPSTRLYFLEFQQPPKIVPPARSQVFKHTGLWETLHSNPNNKGLWR